MNIDDVREALVVGSLLTLFAVAVMAACHGC